MIDTRHEPLLRMIETAVLSGVSSTAHGLNFDWTSPDGRVTRQHRPDEPKDPDVKYLWPKGCELPIGVPPGMQPRVADRDRPLLIVEGTKQHLAAASMALRDPKGEAVVGMSGCWGWRQDGVPLRDLSEVPMLGREVVIALDADISSNRDVHDAAEALGDYCLVEGGAASVTYIILPGKTDGFDDILGRAADPEATYRRLVAGARSKLPRKPSPRRGSPLFGSGGELLAMDAFRALEQMHPLAITQEHTVAVYDEGKYHNGESRYFGRSIVELLGNDFRATHAETITRLALDVLATTGRRIPVQPDRRLVNVRNGLLDPVTLTLHPHDPEFRALFQFDIEWDPDAECPTFDRWIEEVIPGRRDELLDAVAPMLDPTVVPAKAVFLYGYARSGKSTFGRILHELVGAESCSAVTLHQLSDDRFAAANLYGKVLNLAMDLAPKDVRDLSTFKLLTGNDPVNANRKYGQQFSFTNQALLVFSANEVPPVSETSKAWISRVAPFRFPFSYLGAEDPAIEEKMVTEELKGIFRLLVLALQAHIARGRYLDTSAHPDVEEFARTSNRVAMYLYERTSKQHRPGVARSALYADYRVWCDQSGGAALGKQRFFASLRTEGVAEFTGARDGIRRFELELIDPEKGPTGGNEDAPDGDDSKTALLSHPPYGYSLVDGNSQTYRGSKAETAVDAVTAVDTETADAAFLFSGHPQFLRLACTPAGPAEPSQLPGHTLAAHNGFGFDFHAIPGLDVIAEGDAGRLIDTQVLGILDHPPLGRRSGREVMRDYSLAAMAERYGIEGKSLDLKALAKRHGGFDMIPVDDPDYVGYCTQDAAIVAELVEKIGLSDYARREMRVMSRLAGPITGTGFAVDRALLDSRLADREARLGDRRQWLADRFGLPLDSAMPHRTTAGKDALNAAFTELGADPEKWPAKMRTAKGAPSFGGDAMDELVRVASAQGEHEDLVELAEVVKAMNKERSVYGTALDNLHLDGRVHPSVFPAQASGRFSTWDPGLTVYGKRGGKFVERDIFVADEGCLLVAFDLNQIDARAVAVHSQDEAYLKLFVPGVDSHTEVALALWGDAGRREEAKMIAHAWNYGSGVRNIVAHTGLPEATVQEFDRGMRERFPRLVEWRREVFTMGKSGAMLDNGFGRLLKVDPEFAYTQAPAYMGQSTARDLMVEGVLRLPLDIVRMIRAFVHDEIVLSIPESSVEDVSREVLDALTFRWAPPGASMDVEITTGASRAARSWGGCYVKEA